ncbi:MAG TPA: Gfo/Idh/MocA family oxidoreductase [Planctomycetaceae bacterium]|nr:Gfo/Idh/MocA family oxidoreductase [Planctomycetaceae bacterium]HQZ63709.1 Gfo/Idh/MocA family oxidoreductase [Planctomycetaceae bacterium]
MNAGFGIVGTGMIAHFHAKAIQAMNGGLVVGCFNQNVEKANAFAADYGCNAYSTLDELLADPDISVVTICTPSGAHRDPAIAAARAGRHVVVEKPLEITLQRCDDIIKACEENGVKLCTIFPSRFSPANMALKAAIDAGRFGRITLADTYVKWWRTQEYYDGGGWRGTWALDGGGAFMNQAIHNVDLLSWLMGDVSEIAGFTGTLAHERIEVEDVGVACLKFANGAIGVMEATTAAWPGLLKKTEIHGSRGTAIIEQDSIIRWEFADEIPEDAEIRAKLGAGSAVSGGASDPKAISFVGHQMQLEDFVESIAAGRQPRVDGAEGRRSVEIILAIYEAAKTGRSQKLPVGHS